MYKYFIPVVVIGLIIAYWLYGLATVSKPDECNSAMKLNLRYDQNKNQSALVRGSLVDSNSGLVYEKTGDRKNISEGLPGRYTGTQPEDGKHHEIVLYTSGAVKFIISETETRSPNKDQKVGKTESVLRTIYTGTWGDGGNVGLLIAFCQKSHESSKVMSKQTISSGQTSSIGLLSVHRVLMELYEHGTSGSAEVLSIAKLGTARRPIWTTGIKYNREGKRTVREIHFSGYTVSEPDGSLYVIEPKDLTDPSVYTDIYRKCAKEGQVFLMGFGKNPDVPERNVHELMLGPTLQSSILVEYLGALSSPPQGFIGWGASLSGKTFYRLWSIDQETGKKLNILSYLVDIVEKHMEIVGVQPKHFVLKKVYPVDIAADIPEFFFTLPSGRYVERNRAYDYDGEVIDERGRPTQVGVFRRFQGGRTYSGINGPEM